MEFLAFAPFHPRLVLGLAGESGDFWVAVHLSPVLLARRILSSILTKNKSPALPPQSEHKLLLPIVGEPKPLQRGGEPHREGLRRALGLRQSLGLAQPACARASLWASLGQHGRSKRSSALPDSAPW